MSHRTEVKSKLNNREYLIKALNNLGYKLKVSEKDGENTLTTRGHYGVHEKVEVLIEEKNGRSIDDAIGMQLGSDGTYKATGDFYGTGVSAKTLINDVTTEAKKLEANDRLMQLGFSLENTQDNSQELTLNFTRWV